MRAASALGASLILHALVVVAVMGSQLVRLWPSAPALEIEVISTPPKALPLGEPAAPSSAAPAPAVVAEAPVAPRKKRPRPQPPADAGASDADVGDALAGEGPGLGSGDAGLPNNLRAEGPEGARLVVKLRLDRLRAAPHSQAFTSLTDTLLQLLPDRRRLLDGSGLDLFADFDALVVATPNPLDDAVTFLAVRHHLDDAALMQALGRAAVGAGRPIEWVEQRGRPVGLRPSNARQSRDDRLFVLPEPAWVVIAPQAYMALLLPELVGGSPDPAQPPESFATLAARLRGEESAMPPDAVMSASMADLLSTRAGQTLTLPGAGALPLPRTLMTHVALQPQPVLAVELGFDEAADAERWARALPDLRRQYAGHPLVVLGGMSAVVNRITIEQVARAAVTRGKATVIVTAPMDQGEAERILTLVTNLLRGQLGR